MAQEERAAAPAAEGAAYFSRASSSGERVQSRAIGEGVELEWDEEVLGLPGRFSRDLSMDVHTGDSVRDGRKPWDCLANTFGRPTGMFMDVR